MADLTPYVPRFLLSWEQRYGDTRHQAIDGSLVFADVSGFTRLSERLARAGGKVGAEQMTDVINHLFGDLLMVAARRGGEMLKYGGDALLLLFLGDHHAAQAAAACHEMQARLREIGRVETGAGAVRLRMSVGVHSGSFDMFRVGAAHSELVIAGPAASMTCAMEAAADAGEILLSATTAALLPASSLGADKAGGRLLRRLPLAPAVVTEPVPPQRDAERFLSSSVAAHLAQGDVEPDHRLATVAFLHLLGIDTRLAAGEAPSAVADALHDTLSVIQESLHDLGVTFLATDVIADGTKVMASAGAPVAIESAEERMVRALVRIRDAGTPLPVRAGANAGHVFAGDVGPSFRRTYTTIGDVTNTAARVMGRAKAGEVLVLRSVLEQVPTCAAEPQEPFMAKGKTEPLVPYLVGGIRTDRRSRPRPDAVRPLPFAGRDQELATLREAAASAAAGVGAAIEVVGDAGIGKTQLVQQMEAAALRRITARCEPYERQTSYFAVRQLLHPILGAPSDAVGLSTTIRDVASDLLPWLPLIAGIFDVPADPTPESAAVEGRFRRQRTSQLVRELIERGLHDPLLVVVEDVHWLDEASAEVLRHLEAGVQHRPWLLVTTRRPEPATFEARRSLEIGPLEEEVVSRIVAAATEAAPLAPRRVAELISRCGGNPLFLEALLKSDGAAELPSSVEAVVAARIDALPADARHLLRTASVLGTSFEAQLVLEVDRHVRPTSPDSGVLGAQLAEFIQIEDEGRVRFRHQLVRDVAYESLPYRERRRLHLIAGETIEARPGDESAVEVLSLHFAASEQHRKAWRYAVKAARRAAGKYANADAVVLFRRALDAAQRVPDISDSAQAKAWEELGDAAFLASSPAEARRAYRQARRLRRDDRVGFARLCRKEARILEREGKPAPAIRWIRAGERALADDTSTKAVGERARLWALHAWMRRQAGRPDQAVRWAERAILEGGRSKSRACREATASAYIILDGAEIALGRPARATNASKALRIYESLGSLADQAVVLNSLGAHAYHRGEWNEALQLFGRSRQNLERIGNHLDAGYGSWNIAEILMDQGRVEEATLELRGLASLWRSIGFALGDALVDWQRGRIEARWGDPCAGLDLLRPVRDRLEVIGVTDYVIGVDAAIAECLLRSGEVVAARQLVEETLARDIAAGGTPALPSLHRLRGFAAASEGRVADSWAAFDESLHEARRRQSPFDIALALEGFSVLSSLGASPVEGVEQRAELLQELGVIASPPPPIARAMARL